MNSFTRSRRSSIRAVATVATIHSTVSLLSCCLRPCIPRPLSQTRGNGGGVGANGTQQTPFTSRTWNRSGRSVPCRTATTWWRCRTSRKRSCSKARSPAPILVCHVRPRYRADHLPSPRSLLGPRAPNWNAERTAAGLRSEDHTGRLGRATVAVDVTVC